MAELNLCWYWVTSAALRVDWYWLKEFQILIGGASGTPYTVRFKNTSCFQKVAKEGITAPQASQIAIELRLGSQTLLGRQQFRNVAVMGKGMICFQKL